MTDKLEYPGEWKFAEVDEIPAMPPSLARFFRGVLLDIASATDATWDWVEAFKRHFGVLHQSSSLDWYLLAVARGDVRPGAGDACGDGRASRSAENQDR